MKDLTLLDIFLTQALSALAVMERESCSDAERKREMDDLSGAAELLGNAEIESLVAQIIDAWHQEKPESHRDLSSMIADLRPQRAPVVRAESQGGDKTSRKQEPNESAGEPTDTDAAQSKLASTQRGRSNKFDTGEHLTLLNFFREEASEGLDQITEMLLASTEHAPTEALLNELMRLTHGLKGAAGTVDLPSIAELAHQYEDVVERIRQGLLSWSLALRDELVEVADQLRIVIADAVDPAATHAGAQRLGHRLAAIEALPKDRENSLASSLLVVEAKSAQAYPERRRPDRRSANSPMLRVDPIRIDRLIGSASELVFDRTRIEKRVGELAIEVQSLQEALDTLNQERAGWVERGTPLRADQANAALSKLEAKITSSLPQITGAMSRLQKDTSLLRRTELALRDGLTGVRMQSVHSLFQRLTPQLRAIARQANKQVRLVTAGGDTEFDKTVADQMVDPIIQLLRNAVAHGIEAPETRETRGKNPEGRITVTARHEGNVVVLEVSDDGGGINTAALRARAVQNKKWSEERSQQINDQRLVQLIFEPGYTSRTEADALAGRGVGLSAVRQIATRLGGEVQVASVPRRGTTFTIRLPLTTAVVDAMLFKVGGHVFALPNVHVVETSSTALPLATTHETSGGQAIPLVQLHELLGFVMPEGIENTPLLVLEYLGKRLALPCDKVVGPREIVVNSLGPLLAGVHLYAGATISPSGKVQLILDTPVLVTQAYPDHENSTKEVSSADALSDQPMSTRVLVVDDSKATREAMRRMLERAGYEVFSAHDGKSAWNSINEVGCDMVVTDLEMPGEDGFQLLERMRADPRYREMPALVISSKNSEKNRERAARLAAIDFLPKPVGQEELIDALRSVQRKA